MDHFPSHQIFSELNVLKNQNTYTSYVKGPTEKRIIPRSVWFPVSEAHRNQVEALKTISFPATSSYPSPPFPFNFSEVETGHDCNLFLTHQLTV